MNERDQELIEAASKLLEERYLPPVHSVAAALRTKTGEIISSVNIDHFSGYVCGEMAVLSRAINDEKYDLETIVAVRFDDEGNIGIANMCGKCRQIIHDYAPGMRVISADQDTTLVKTIEELLPYSFTRQQKKIQAVIHKGVENV